MIQLYYKVIEADSSVLLNFAAAFTITQYLSMNLTIFKKNYSNQIIS